MAMPVIRHIFSKDQKPSSTRLKPTIFAGSGDPKPKNPQIADAQVAARELLLEAEDEVFRLKKAAEEEAGVVRAAAIQLETRLVQKEEAIDQAEKALEEERAKIAKKTAEIDELKVQLTEKLEKVAGLTKQEASKQLIDQLEAHLALEIARRIKEAEEEIKVKTDSLARQVIVNAMNKVATDYVAEYTVSTIALPDEEIKGRIIGKEGRNIRVLEVSTGVDIDLEEEEVVRLSSFDPVRREIARVALERLIKDGRIQPARIEEFVQTAKRDVEKIIYEAGLALATEVGVHNLSQGLISLLGKFKFRTSFGQNQWLHTLEVVKIAVSIAIQIKANVDLTRRIALFHDIGKVAEEEGPQEEVGAAVLRKFGIEDAVVAGVASQHTDNFSSIESAIVFVADAISAARPGARHEPHEEYVKRISEIENIAKSFEGVTEAFALEAGREVRVIVVPEKVDDTAIAKLAHDIAENVRQKVTVPGQLKVTIIRETRAQATA